MFVRASGDEPRGTGSQHGSEPSASADDEAPQDHLTSLRPQAPARQPELLRGAALHIDFVGRCRSQATPSSSCYTVHAGTQLKRPRAGTLHARCMASSYQALHPQAGARAASQMRSGWSARRGGRRGWSDAGRRGRCARRALPRRAHPRSTPAPWRAHRRRDQGRVWALYGPQARTRACQPHRSTDT